MWYIHVANVAIYFKRVNIMLCELYLNYLKEEGNEKVECR